MFAAAIVLLMWAKGQPFYGICHPAQLNTLSCMAASSVFARRYTARLNRLVSGSLARVYAAPQNQLVTINLLNLPPPWNIQLHCCLVFDTGNSSSGQR